MGVLFMVGVFLLIQFTLYSFTWCLKNKHPICEKAAEILEKAVFWNSLSEYMYVSYFIMTLSVLLNYQSGLNWTTNSAITSNVFLLIGTALVVGWPIWLTIFLKKNYNEDGFKIIRQKLAFIYDRIKLRKTGNWSAITTPCIFMAKRLLLLVVCLFESHLCVQIICIISIQFMSMVFTIVAKPFASRQQMMIEMFNECVLLLLFY